MELQYNHVTTVEIF